MLDEAHDCTACQISVFAAARGRKILVYDTHQAIFQFRYADPVPMIRSLPHVAWRPLTQAWRYGEQLAAGERVCGG